MLIFCPPMDFKAVPGSQAYISNSSKKLPNFILGKVKSFQGRFMGEVFWNIEVLKGGGGLMPSAPPPPSVLLENVHLLILLMQVSSYFYPERIFRLLGSQRRDGTTLPPE